jgi:hypothetical protein
MATTASFSLPSFRPGIDNFEQRYATRERSRMQQESKKSIMLNLDFMDVI